MQRTAYLLRFGNGSAFFLPAAGFCIFGFVAPNWYQRYRLGMIDGATLGAFAGQFLWSVAWCALGPGRWIFRYLAVTLAGAAIAGALLAGIALKPETDLERRMAQIDRATGHEFTRRERALHDLWQSGLGFPLSLLVCQLPLAWNHSYRGWRIVFRETQTPMPEAELLKFGLSDLFGATAGVAIAFATWRLGISQLSKGSYGTEEALAVSFFCVFLSLIAGLLVLPIVPLVLGERPRRLALSSAGVYLLGIVILLTSVLMFLDKSARSFAVVSTVTAYLAAMASSALAVFWLAREFGFRLLQVRRRGESKPPRVRRLRPRVKAKVDQFNIAMSGAAAIACSTAAGICILLWLVALSAVQADLGFAFGIEDEITVARGSISVSTILSSRNAQAARLNPARPHRWKAPGIEIGRLEDYGGRTWLIAKFSLLVPGAAAAILSAFFVRRYKRCRMALANFTASNVAPAAATPPPVVSESDPSRGPNDDLRPRQSKR